MTEFKQRLLRGSAALALAIGLAGAPAIAQAQWWEDEGLYENEEEYLSGAYEDQAYDDDDWFYDEYDEDYEVTNYAYDYGYNDYENYGSYYEEDFEEDEGWFDWF